MRKSDSKTRQTPAQSKKTALQEITSESEAKVQEHATASKSRKKIRKKRPAVRKITGTPRSFQAQCDKLDGLERKIEKIKAHFAATPLAHRDYKNRMCLERLINEHGEVFALIYNQLP